MKAKTIQRMSPTIFVSTEMGFDRLNHHAPYRFLLKELIDMGEISRYRNENDVFVKYEPDTTIIEMVWNSRSGAEYYAEGLRKLDPAKSVVFSIDIEDITD